MGNVFASVGMSLDARIAGPDRGPANPLGDRGVQIHAWMYRTRAFRENLKLAEGGDIGADDDIVNATTRRTGATHGVRAPCEARSRSRR